MGSLYDIGYDYILEHVEHIEISDELKQGILAEIKVLLQNNWTEEEIKQILIEVDWKETILPRKYFLGRKPIKINLLNPNQFYYHSQLRIFPAPIKKQIDYNTGEIVTVNKQEYFLEMKSSYTIDDAVLYYCKQMNLNVPKEDKEKNRFAGPIKYIVDKIGIEMFLFCVDSASNHIKEMDLKRLKSPLEVQDYYDDAKNNYNAKITEERLSGSDKIVPKRRVPLDRMRGKYKNRI